MPQDEKTKSMVPSDKPKTMKGAAEKLASNLQAGQKPEHQIAEDDPGLWEDD